MNLIAHKTIWQKESLSAPSTNVPSGELVQTVDCVAIVNTLKKMGRKIKSKPDIVSIMTCESEY